MGLSAVQDVFLRISYRQPALRAAEPSHMEVSIAPIDMIYSQVSSC